MSYNAITESFTTVYYHSPTNVQIFNELKFCLGEESVCGTNTSYVVTKLRSSDMFKLAFRP